MTQFWQERARQELIEGRSGPVLVIDRPPLATDCRWRVIDSEPVPALDPVAVGSAGGLFPTAGSLARLGLRPVFWHPGPAGSCLSPLDLLLDEAGIERVEDPSVPGGSAPFSAAVLSLGDSSLWEVDGVRLLIDQLVSERVAVVVDWGTNPPRPLEGVTAAIWSPSSRTGKRATIPVGSACPTAILLSRGETWLAAVSAPIRSDLPAGFEGSAGDWRAGFVAGLGWGLPAVEAFALGCSSARAGAEAAAKGHLLSAPRLMRSLHQKSGTPEQKILSPEQALKWRALVRAAGDRLVFTNGCFDLLHSGHMRVLEEASRRGDFLLVGLNSDQSVRALKGPTRPVLPEQERALMLAGLPYVDGVVLFDDPSVHALIGRIQPDVLVKGGDYAREEVVGWDIVDAIGGEVVTVPVVEGISTTSIIERIAPLQGTE